MKTIVINAPINPANGIKYAKEATSIGKNKKKIAIATPAPALIPIIPGSAKSFRVILCKIDPDNASAIPANKVIVIRGKRTEYKINSSLNVPCPNNV